MNQIPLTIKKFARLAGVAMLPLALAGCPTGVLDPQAEYDLGFVAGFAVDEEYWQGFDDSYDTVDAGPIYYSGSEIPFYEDPPYDAGYWDGVWYAYNDGYFVAYDYAFTIGFSEGYDIGHQPAYASFLEGDEHLEYLDGGFTDGYNDGFSEGRVFGAYDYANGIAFDWLDAMLDYRAGLDLTVAGVSTGNSGPVYLYEYGVDPADIIEGKADAPASTRGSKAGIRRLDNAEKSKQEDEGISYRPLTSAVRADFSVRPSNSPRSNAVLRLESNWLARVEAYLAALESGADAKSNRE